MAEEKRVVLRLGGLDPQTRRRIVSAHLIGKRRAEARARGDMDALAARFEAVNEQTLSEIRALRSELTRLRMVDEALLERERDAPGWLH